MRTLASLANSVHTCNVPSMMSPTKRDTLLLDELLEELLDELLELELILVLELLELLEELLDELELE